MVDVEVHDVVQVPEAGVLSTLYQHSVPKPNVATHLRHNISLPGATLGFPLRLRKIGGEINRAFVKNEQE